MTQTNYVGTRWHKCDLHLHTPASLCFRDRDTVTPEQWVQAALDKGLSCVAVTDHNTGEWIDKIKASAAGTGLTVFPGVEITCSDAKVHLLVLFETDKTTQDVDDFLLKAHIERKDFGQQTAHSRLSCEDVMALAEVRGGIVIPAHIDEFNGICEMGNQPRKEFLERRQIKSVQVVSEEFLLSDKQYQSRLKEGFKTHLNKKYGWTDEQIAQGKWKIDDARLKSWRQAVVLARSNNKAILTFSDNPHEPNDSQHGLWGIGSRFTWIKMDAQPSLECLQQALLVPEDRIMNDFEIEAGAEPYQLPDIWIEKVKFGNTVITGLENSVEAQFSPQMTNIVGGRGSGKSSVLGFVRGLFPSYVDELDDLPSIKEEFKNFFCKPNRNGKGVFNDATEVELFIHRRNTEYRIDYKVNEGSESKVYRKNKISGDWELEGDRNFIDLFDLDIFSQKQVYEIANRPNALRNKIDGDIEGIGEIKQQLKEKKAGFLSHCAYMRELEERISRKSVLETEIKDIESRLASLDIDSLKEQLKNRQGFSKQESVLKSFQNDLEEQYLNLKAALDDFKFPNINIDAFGETHQEDIKKLIEKHRGYFTEVKTEFEKVVDTALLATPEFQVELDVTSWSKNKQESEESYQSQQEEIKNQGLQELSDPAEIEREMRIVSKKRQEIHEIEALEIELAEAVTEKAKMKAEYFEVRTKLTNERRVFLGTILKDNVKANVIPCGDLDYWEQHFRNNINSHGSYGPELIALRDRWQPKRKPLDNNESYMKIFNSIRNNTYRGNDFSGHFIRRINGLGAAQMDELDLLVPEDRIVVNYKANAKSSFKPIATASPGQKTAAILTFLLSHGDRPLIIDQPEDDLDTSLIHSLVVNQLKSSKKRRQVIVVTHNPNIPVNGDSEQIIVMNADSKNVETKRMGSIDDEEIRKLICDVMEGGSEAFNLRSQRYNLS